MAMTSVPGVLPRRQALPEARSMAPSRRIRDDLKMKQAESRLFDVAETGEPVFSPNRAGRSKSFL
jgi:hypothetical protein